MTTETDSPETAAAKKQRPLWVEVLVRLLVGFGALALLTHLVAQPYVIPSSSMEPTLQPGDRGVARVLGVDSDAIERGTVIAFSHGATWASPRLEEPHAFKNALRYVGDVVGVGPSHHAYTVKRVVGLPGETVSCCDSTGRVLVDGEPLDEHFVTMDLAFAEEGCTSPLAGAPSMRCFPEVTVPEDSYLVLGDNRANSSDSVTLCRGLVGESACAARFVHSDQVVGTVGWRYWPLPPGDALRGS